MPEVFKFWSSFLPFSLKLTPSVVLGVSLWSLALYLSLFPVSEWVATQLQRWFNYAERSLYTSSEEFERTRAARESQNAFYGAILSIIPFLLVGALCHAGLRWGLGESWALALGFLGCVGGGVYELGRRDGQASK